MTKKLIACHEICKGRQTIRPGDHFEVPEQDARVLVAVGMAEYEPGTVPAEPLQLKRQYRRRDMKAEKP